MGRSKAVVRLGRRLGPERRRRQEEEARRRGQAGQEEPGQGQGCRDAEVGVAISSGRIQGKGGEAPPVGLGEGFLTLLVDRVGEIWARFGIRAPLTI